MSASNDGVDVISCTVGLCERSVVLNYCCLSDRKTSEGVLKSPSDIGSLQMVDETSSEGRRKAGRQL